MLTTNVREQLEALGKEKEASVSHIEEVRREAVHLEERRGLLEKEMAEHIPVQKVCDLLLWNGHLRY